MRIWKTGRSHKFLDEEAFEKDRWILWWKMRIFKKRWRLRNLALSSILFLLRSLSKSRYFIILRRYHDALKILEQAELLTWRYKPIYFKNRRFAGAWSAGKSGELLEKALHSFDGEERIELLFELADVYDDYEEFDKVFDCLKLILNKTLITRKRYIKFVSGPILPDEAKKVSNSIKRSLMIFLIMNSLGLILRQLTRAWSFMRKQLIHINMP